HDSPHVSTRQYARIVEHWVVAAGLDPSAYGTHSMRRTKATLIYKRTKNLRAVQLLLGHSKLESTVRYLGIEVDDALEISEQIEIRTRRGCPPRTFCRRAAAYGDDAEGVLSAITGRWRSGQDFPRWIALGDRFTAANLNPALAPRVRQLRSQVLVFATAHFQKCHYNSANCSGAAGFS